MVPDTAQNTDNKATLKATAKMIGWHKDTLARLLGEAIEYAEWMDDVHNGHSGYKAVADTLRQQLTIVAEHLR